MVVELAAIPMILLYVAIGASVHTIWGVYKAYSTYLFIRIRWARVFIEYIAAATFGIFGAFALSSLMPFPAGVELVGLFSAVLGANVISVVTKKFGISKFEVPVSDQQLGLGEFNARQMNAVEYAKREGKITNRVYQRLNGVSNNVAKKELGKLVEKRMLKRVDSGKRTSYTIDE